MNDTNTKLLNTGLYDFDATQNVIRVFKGKADVYAGDHRITLTRERELSLNSSGRLKTQEFDTRKYEDEFFRWSALRSGYVSEASVDEARAYIGVGPSWFGPGWYGPGWYWDPNFFVYTFLPADGIFIARLAGASTRRSMSTGRLSSSMVITAGLILLAISLSGTRLVLSRSADFTEAVFME